MNKKVKTIILVLLAFAYSKAEGQTVSYTYNAQGSCTSRNIRAIARRAQKANKSTIDSRQLKVTLSPSSSFQDQLSISVSGLPSEHNLSYIMANISGQVVFSGSIENGTTTITTTALPKGIYVVKINGEDFEESYKILKKR